MKYKQLLKQYRGVIIVALFIVLNVVESLYFGMGTSLGFNINPNSVAELICDAICSMGFIYGIAMIGFDWVDYFNNIINPIFYKED